MAALSGALKGPECTGGGQRGMWPAAGSPSERAESDTNLLHRMVDSDNLKKIMEKCM